MPIVKRTSKKALDEIHQTWLSQWPTALACWSHFIKLREPTWCRSAKEEKEAGLSGSFAMIRLADHTIVISLRQVAEMQLHDFALEVLAHEIGHHVYCPADLSDNARLAARIRAGLPTKEHLTGFISNLYSDLLINDRLQRSAGLNMAGVYERLDGGTADRLWTLYMRVYELLWSLPRGQYAKGKIDARLNQDAQLAARLVRSYGKDWLDGGGRFAALCLPYLLEDEADKTRKAMQRWLDTQCAGSGQLPDGLAEIDPYEVEGAIHPAEDPILSGIETDADAKADTGNAAGGKAHHGGRKTAKTYRDPMQYAEVLKAAGVEVDERQIVAKYYRERALPHLIRFPTREQPRAVDPIPEGLDLWDIDSPIAEIDWIGTLAAGDQVIPGITTRRRMSGDSPGEDRQQLPIDLYLGVDCSGSMGNPAHSFSYPVLAGAIVSLSALRAGSKVMVALSGEPGRTLTTGEFARRESLIMSTLTDYLGTGYAFGIHRLEETFGQQERLSRPVHMLIVSDNDMFTMLDSEQDGMVGWDIAARAIEQAGGGGTFVLELPDHVRSSRWGQNTAEYLSRMEAIGWNVSIVSSMEQLVQFARDFSKRNYSRDSATRRQTNRTK